MSGEFFFLHCNFVPVVSPAGTVSVDPEYQTQQRLDNATFVCSTLAGPDNMFLWFYRATTELCEVCQSDLSVVNLTGMSQLDFVFEMFISSCCEYIALPDVHTFSLVHLFNI